MEFHDAPLFALNPLISQNSSVSKPACPTSIEQLKVSVHSAGASDGPSALPDYLQPGPWQRTQQPIVTGTSVLALVFKDGIMMAADTLGSYGSLARFRDERRLFQCGNNTCVGASGDLSDMQFIQHKLTQLLTEDFCVEDGHEYSSKNIYEYLCRMMYSRRCKMNPLWNSLVVGGVDPKTGEKMLGCVDIHGTTWQSSTLATGFGSYLAQPLLRKAVEGKETVLTQEQASKIMDDCLRVLYYRDARSLNNYQKAVITKTGVSISEPYSLSTEWEYAKDIRGYGA